MYGIFITDTTTMLARVNDYLQAKEIINKQMNKDLNSYTYTIQKIL